MLVRNLTELPKVWRDSAGNKTKIKAWRNKEKPEVLIIHRNANDSDKSWNRDSVEKHTTTDSERLRLLPTPRQMFFCLFHAPFNVQRGIERVEALSARVARWAFAKPISTKYRYFLPSDVSSVYYTHLVCLTAYRVTCKVLSVRDEAVVDAGISCKHQRSAQGHEYNWGVKNSSDGRPWKR